MTTAKVVKNPHAQGHERIRHIEVLAEIGTMSAVTALLGRFTMRTDGAIVDEDEGLVGLRLYVDKRNTGAQGTYEALGMTREHYHLYEWMK